MTYVLERVLSICRCCAAVLVVCGILSACTVPGTQDPGTRDLAVDPPPPPNRVLVQFIGNSITYVNDIPGRFRSIMETRGYPAGYEGTVQITPGGSTIQERLLQSNHFAGQALVNKPAYIFLQEQSTGPGPLPAYDSQRWVPFYQAVAAEIGAEVLYYQTWHVGFGIDYQNSVDTLDSYTPSIGVALAPAGPVWQNIYASDGTLDFDPDGVHQNAQGAAINAAVFYYTLFPNAPKVDGILSMTGLSIDNALEASWNTIIYDTVRGYSYAALRGAEFIGGLRTTDAVGGTIEHAVVLDKAPSQTIIVDVGFLDVDLYKLPSVDAGQTLRLTRNDLKGFMLVEVGVPNTVIFDQDGTPIDYTAEALETVSFTPTAGRIYYLAVIGDNRGGANYEFGVKIEVL